MLLGKILIGPGPIDQFPDPVGQQRVTDAVAAANDGIELLADQDPNVVFVNPFALIGPRLNPQQTAFDVGGVSIAIAACNDPTCALVADQIHPGSVASGLMAHAFLEAANTHFGTEIPLFSDLEILQTADEFDDSAAISVPDLDLGGVWQVTVDCGGEFAASALMQFVQNPSTGDVTVSIHPLCGYLSLFPGADPEPLATCTRSAPDSLVDGTRFSGPQGGGFALHEVTFVNPVTLIPPCDGNPHPIGRIEVETRVDGWIVEDDGVNGTRIEGVVTRGLSSVYNTIDQVCFSGTLVPALCTAVYRPAGIATQGTPQTVVPQDGVALTFDAVSTGGAVLVSEVAIPPGSVPPGLDPAAATALAIATDAVFSGPITVCLDYPDADDDGIVDGTTPPVSEDTLVILHETAGGYEDVTVSRSPSLNRVCGEVTSLSIFVLAASQVRPVPGLLPWGLAVLVGVLIGVTLRASQSQKQATT